MATLAEKRAEVIERHKAQEQFDPHWKAEAAAGRKISERPVAFLCDDEVVVTGDCVGKVMEAVKTFLDLASHGPLTRADSENHLAYAIAKCQQIASRPATAELRVSQQRWNAICYAMSIVGVECVLTDGAD